MNVLVALIGVKHMQHATTMTGVTPALATVDTEKKDPYALVSHVSIAYLIILLF